MVLILVSIKNIKHIVLGKEKRDFWALSSRSDQTRFT